MNVQTPGELLLPASDNAYAEPIFAPVAEGINEDVEVAVEGDFSSIGLLCDGIFTVISAVPDCPDDAMTSIALRISGILSMFTDSERKARETKKRIADLSGKLRHANEQLAVLRQEHFGKSSEKAGQETESNELEILLNDTPDDEEEEKTKGKRKRKLPKGIEPLVVHHYPPDRNCCSCGCQMKPISNWTSTRVRLVPEHVQVIKDVYHTCACNNREICKDNKPMAAKTQNFILKGTSIDPQFIAEVAIQKFFEHLPVYRLARRLRAANFNISAQMLGANIGRVAEKLEPLAAEFLKEVKSGHAAHMDETPLRVQAPGKGKCDTGYIWAICRDERRWNPDAKPVVFYHYAPTRKGDVAKELLEGSELQFLQTDGYTGYNQLFRKDGDNTGLDSVRCWAHARRNFHEAEIATKSPLAIRMKKAIQKMYLVEEAVAGLPPVERQTLRQEKTLPLLIAMRADLEKNAPKAEGLVRKAINYTLNAFDALQRFVFDGRLEIDNNPIERCIRGIALTKKNSLFAGNHQSAKTWAIYYSLIETARLNSINPRSYMKWVPSTSTRAARSGRRAGAQLPASR